MSNNDFYLKDMFIESPVFDNWFKKHFPQNSLLICSAYIKKAAFDKIVSLYKLNNRSTDFDLKVLIRGNACEFTHQKSSDIAVFDSLKSLKGFDLSNVKRVTNLHMKAYLIDGRHLLITSANLTNSGMFSVSGKENFEGSISTNDPKLILKFLEYFSYIWNQGEVFDEFYDALMSAYADYIKNKYSDKDTLVRLSRRRYKFKTKTDFNDIEQSIVTRSRNESANSISELPLDALSNNGDEIPDDLPQKFTLDDIPPVGKFEHLTEVLKYVSEYEDGITYLELGRKLRPIFGNSESTAADADRKFGEEKGKFAAFFNLVNIEKSRHEKIFKINNLGKLYMSLNNEEKNKFIKDIFFDKPIAVSIMKQNLETHNFNLLDFLINNCEGATRNTLSRKVSPLKEIFSYIQSICTEEELRNALNI